MEDPQAYDLSTKDGLMAYLGTFPPNLIFDFLAQTNGGHMLQDLAAFGHQVQSQAAASVATSDNDEITPSEPVETVMSENRPLRPLNAFMGFRSWYSKILPDAQQKDISAFITKLWEKDVRRNEWSLIAKLYSSIRDTVGKKNITLKGFLSHACPIMQIIPPEHYLETFKWVVTVNEAGDRSLQQDEAAAANAVSRMTQDSPTTEMELLQAVLNDGYMPNYALVLLERLAGSANGMMTTSRGNKFQDFVQSLINDPTGTAAEVIGSSSPVIVNTAEVEDISRLDDVYILAENELSHYPPNANFETDNAHVYNRDGNDTIELSIGGFEGFMGHTGEVQASFDASGPMLYNHLMTAPQFDRSDFHHGSSSSMDDVSISNVFSADYMQHDDSMSFLMTMDQQQMGSTTTPGGQHQHGAYNGNFRYY